MSPEERRAHQDRMARMHDLDECRAYLRMHHDRMGERARERGMAMPAMPRRDGCRHLMPDAKR